MKKVFKVFIKFCKMCRFLYLFLIGNVTNSEISENYGTRNNMFDYHKLIKFKRKVNNSFQTNQNKKSKTVYIRFSFPLNGDEMRLRN